MPGYILGSHRIYLWVDSRWYHGVDHGDPRINTSLPGFTPLSWFDEMSFDPRIHPSFPEYTPFLTITCDPPKIHCSFQNIPPSQQLYATLPESTPPSQNIILFLTTVCDPPRIYPSLPEYTTFSTTIYIYVRPSQNLPLPPRIYPLLLTIGDTPRIYPYILEYTLPF